MVRSSWEGLGVRASTCEDPLGHPLRIWALSCVFYFNEKFF